MKIEDMKKKKEELGVTAEMISAASGVPLSTVQKIFSGVTKTPRKATLDAIANVLGDEGDEKPDERWDKKRDGDDGNRYSDLVCEAQGQYLYKPSHHNEKRNDDYRRFTIEDYYALPDERRVELIDGVFYDMSAPAIIHQKILGELYIIFRECMDRHEGECEVYLSPCDVRLDRDNRTMVQPDLLVVCREYDIGARAFDGAPDLTLEILSPSTRSKDMLLKLYKYANAGVREYWIVDSDNRAVLVYDLEHEDYYPRKYSFEDTIPIGISGGACSIDFSRVTKRIARYYEQ